MFLERRVSISQNDNFLCSTISLHCDICKQDVYYSSFKDNNSRPHKMNTSVNLIHLHFLYILASPEWPHQKSALAYELFFFILSTNLKIAAVPPTFTSLWTFSILQSAVGHSFEGCMTLEKFPFSFTKTARHQLALKMWTQMSCWIFLKQTYHLYFTNLC